jgi:hypothetical protein
VITAETFNQVMAVVRKDLDPATVAIVEDLLHNGERLLVIRDAFLEERDALAVKMIRDLDPNRNMSLLPISVDLRNRPYSQPEGVVTNQAFQITARPQRCPFRPRYLLLRRLKLLTSMTSVLVIEARLNRQVMYLVRCSQLICQKLRLQHLM